MTAFGAIEACVFDAYGTLFDVHSAVGQHRERVGREADRLSSLWRTKQLEYTWLRSLMGAYVDFWQVTQDALDYALDTCGITESQVKTDLMNAYLALDCYAEVKATLVAIRERGLKTAILSNGSPRMLEAAVESSGLGGLLDAVYSVDEIGVYKPDGRVYQLACDRLGLPPGRISFQSSNAWDAVAAAYQGMAVAWVNRFGQKPERLPGNVRIQLETLDQLLELLPRG
jgi:2-haloacid dehalogenase